eukprot:COSAG04_NODE_391_length_15160_cov_4.380725_5_plen_237_part_00
MCCSSVCPSPVPNQPSDADQPGCDLAVAAVQVRISSSKAASFRVFQPTHLTCRPRATDRYKGNNQWVDQNLVRHTLPRQQNALPFLPLRLCSGASCAQGAWLDFMEGGGAGTETSPAPISPPLGTCTRLPIPAQRQLPGIELTECLCVDPRVTAAGAMTLEAEDDDSARSPSPDSPAPFSLHSADPHDRPPAGDSDDGAVSGTPELSPKQGGTPASPRSALANSPPSLVYQFWAGD